MIGRPPSELLGHLISDAIPETNGSRFHDVSEEGGAASPPVEQPRGSTRLQALQRTA
jgi:hypothetical protein